MILLQSIQTDFVLTTLATRQQSKIFPQHIAPETPGSTFAMCFFPWETNLAYFHLFTCFCRERESREKTDQKTKTQKHVWSQESFSQVKPNAGVIPVAKPKSLKKKTGKSKNMCFSLFYNHVSFFFHVLHFFHVFSFLFIFSYFLSLLFISCFLSLKKTVANPDNRHVDPLLCFVDKEHFWEILHLQTDPLV